MKLWVITHAVCGKTAFYAKTKPYPGMLMRSSDFVQLDGSHLELASDMVCGSCGENIKGPMYLRLEPAPVDVPTLSP